jgi:Domain of unknown function (DUF4187)/G-patch domain
MSDEEDDYMSDKFTTGETSSSCGRESLIRDRKKRRMVELEAKKQSFDEASKSKKDKKQESLERLHEGLQTKISSSNKGFEMLRKMGWSGQAIGKSESGIVEPIAIVPKADRRGLGREVAEQQLKARMNEIKQKRSQASNITLASVEAFRKRIAEEKQAAQVAGEVRKCQSACEKIDRDHGFEKPLRPWFWRTVKDPEESDEGEEGDTEDQDSDDEEVELENAEKLQMISGYLRTYFYCNFCGTQYDNEEDMLASCPGTEKDDH